MLARRPRSSRPPGKPAVRGPPRSGAITVVAGSRDGFLVTDARALAQRAREAGVEIEYHEARAMQHCYPLFPLLPEAGAARRLIAERMRG